MTKEFLSSFFCGLLFSLGLGVSGMTQPQKVISFLDISGSWDPSLLFVMVGAVLVYSVGYRWTSHQPKPLFTSAFLIPTSKIIDRTLLVGSAIFGVGWGLAGFCPGPALTSLVSFHLAPWIFVASMLLTMAFYEGFQRRKGSS